MRLRPRRGWNRALHADRYWNANTFSLFAAGWYAERMPRSPRQRPKVSTPPESPRAGPARGASVRALARELGLNSSTVSRALRGHPAIRPATIRRVREAAERAGYRPNPDVALAMAAVRRAPAPSLQGLFGVLDFYPEFGPDGSPTAASPIFLGLQRRAQEIGWRADLLRVGADALSPARVRGVLIARGIVGVVLLPPPMRAPLPELDLEGIEVVCASSAWLAMPALARRPFVLPAHWSNARMLFDHLRAAGYARPLLHIHESIEERHIHATVGAFLLSQWRRYWARNILIYRGDLKAEAARRLLRRHAPDVIVGPDLFVKEFFERDVGLRFPRDGGFFAYGRVIPGVASFDQRPLERGAAAADLLTGMILHRGSPVPEAPRRLTVLGRILSGPTLPTRNGNARLSAATVKEPARPPRR